MKSVWKCDFCSSTDVSIEKMKLHELSCSFNPINKKCYSCEYRDWSDGWGDSYTICKIDLDVLDGEEDGNCSGWYPDDINEIRKIKLEKLNKL